MIGRLAITIAIVLAGGIVVGELEAADTYNPREAPPAWVGTVLGAGGKIDRPATLCKRRGGVAHQAAYGMSGRALERRRDREGLHWVGRNDNVVAFYRGGTFYSAQNRATLVVAWCARPRPPRRDTVIIEPDGGWHFADGNGPNYDPTPTEEANDG